MRTYFKLSLLVVALLAPGCKPANTEPPAPSSTNASTSPTFNDVKTATKEALVQSRDYVYAQKEQFAQKFRGELADLNKRIDELSTNIANVSEATKAEAKEKLAALREKSKHTNEQLDQLKDTSKTKWEEAKEAIKLSWSDLKDSFDQSRQWLADKIAPAPPPPPNTSR